MSNDPIDRRGDLGRERVFGLSDWTAWLDSHARAIFGMSGDDFEREYMSGNIDKSGSAQDLASVLPTIGRLRKLNKDA